MRITKRGTLPADWIWAGKCHTCGTEAEAKQGELEVHTSQRDETWAERPCPVCTGRLLFHRTKRVANPEQACRVCGLPERDHHEFCRGPLAPPRTCAKCGRLETAHDVRHPFVATG